MARIQHRKGKNKEKISAEVTVNLLREDDCFVAYCPDLDLSTHGDSPEEAMKHFQEVLDIFFEDITKKGSLAQVLEDCGWTRVEIDHTPKWIPPAIIAQKQFKIPISA